MAPSYAGKVKDVRGNAPGFGQDLVWIGPECHGTVAPESCPAVVGTGLPVPGYRPARIPAALSRAPGAREK
jgi:hypothetical protein